MAISIELIISALALGGTFVTGWVSLLNRIKSVEVKIAAVEKNNEQREKLIQDSNDLIHKIDSNQRVLSERMELHDKNVLTVHHQYNEFMKSLSEQKELAIALKENIKYIKGKVDLTETFITNAMLKKNE